MKRLGRNVRAQAVGRLAWLAVSIALTPYLFDELGRRLFGVWSLLSGSVAIALLFDLGLGVALVRRVSASRTDQERASCRDAVGLALLLSAGLGAVLVLVAWSLAGPLDGALHLGLGATFRDALLVTAGAAAVIGLAAPFAAILDGSLRMDLTAVGAVLGSLAFAGAAVASIGLGLGLVAPAVGLLAYAVVRAAALSSLAWWRFPTLRPRLRRPDRSSARELVGYGAWVQASNVAGVVNVESDRWVLAAVFSPTTVASFEIGSKIIGVFRLLPTFALAALFPVASQAHGAGRRQEVDRLYLRSTRYLTLAAAGGAALLVAAAEPLVTLWLGVRLNFARDVLWILAPALAFNLSTGAVAMLVRAEGHPAWETRYAAVSVVLNVGFTVPLLVAAGPVGAVAGSALGIALASAYFFSSFHRLSERPLAPLLRIVWPAWTAGALAALVGLAGSRLLSTPSTRPEALLALLVSAALALAAYVLLLTLFGFWSRSERDLVGRGLARARASIRPAEPQRSNE